MLVVLIVEGIFGTIVLQMDAGTDRTFLSWCMAVLIFLLVIIVAGIAIWRPLSLRGVAPTISPRYSLLYRAPGEHSEP